MNRSIAQGLSYLLHPAVYPVLGVLLILKITPYHISGKLVIISLSLVFIGTYLFPIIVSYYLYRLGFIEDLEMKSARDRRLPYLVGALSYYFVATVLHTLELPYEAYLYLIASTCIIILHLFFLRFFKPSAHLAGLGGFTGLLISISVSFGLNLLPFIAAAILLAGFLASARLYLEAHNPGELIAGYVSGVVGVFLILVLLS